MSAFPVLGVIPARGGSKGIPRKNIVSLLGKPLLAYTAAAALQARGLTRVVLTTDDEEIAEVGRGCGLEVPFIRPGELAEDDTPMLPVLRHALRWAENNGGHYDAVCLLQPTSPLRTAETIDGCIELLDRSGADAVVTVLEVPHQYNPHWVYFEGRQGFLELGTGGTEPLTRRQVLPRALHREGSVYVTRRDVLMLKNSIYGERLLGYQIDENSSVNIDSPADLGRAVVMAKHA